MPEGLCSSVQTIICKYKHHGTVQPSYCPGRRRFCVKEMNILQCEMCISTPKQKQNILWRCWLKLVRECHYPHWNKSFTDTGWKTTQPRRSHYSLEMHTGTNTLIFADTSWWSNETKTELIDHNDHYYICYIWKKSDACKPEKTIPTVLYGGGSIML